jgi:methionine biosynthesis protein MetW
MTGEAGVSFDEGFYENKVAVYRHAGNRVITERVKAVLPPGGRVLDVGCGSGVLLALLAGHAGYRAGVELSPTAAAEAAKVADEVVNLPVDGDLPFQAGDFDVVVCADILEHLPEPAGTLASLAGYCRPGGAVVISVPNIANWQARLRLARGIWRYEPAGLFDSGHLRFLTRATLLDMVAEAGLLAESCVPARMPRLSVQVPAVDRLPTPVRQAVNRSWSVGGYALARRWPGLFAYQLVCTARRPG